MENPKSSIPKDATLALNRLQEQLLNVIESYLKVKRELAFTDSVNIMFADEAITRLEIEDNKIFVVTSDNIHGENYRYDLKDESTVAIQDLIWMVEQIENLRAADPGGG